MFGLLLILTIVGLIVVKVQNNTLQNEIQKLALRLTSLERSQSKQPAETSIQPSPVSTSVATEVATETVEPLASYLAKATPKSATKPDAELAFPALAAGQMGSRFEGQLASRWFVWIGAGAVALAGLLFVRYAAVHALLSPLLRVMMGLAFGGILVGAGEFVRRGKIGDGTYVPAALASGGLVTMFGAVYAAHVFYGLLGPTEAFLGLGAIGLGALALSRLQGPLIAAVGLVGSYATPALVVSHDPQALGLFIYLLVILAASFVVMRSRGWDWLGFASLAGCAGWGLLWVVGDAFKASDQILIGLFAFAMAGIATFGLEGRAVLAGQAGNLLNPGLMSRGLRLGLVGTLAAGVILAMQVHRTEFEFVATSFFMAAMAGISVFGLLRNGNSLAAPLAAVASWIVLMLAQDHIFDSAGAITLGYWCALAIIGFTGVGLIGFLRGRPDVIWASLAAAAPVAFLFGLFAKAQDYFQPNLWETGAVLPAVVLATAAARKPKDELSPIVLLAGTAALVLFALTRQFEGVVLTLLVAALAVVFALTTRFFTSRHMGWIIVALATLAEARLFLLHSGFEWHQPFWLGQHWPLYGYGLPAVGFWWASRQLADDKYRRFRIALEGLSLGLVISLVSLEIRAFISGEGSNHVSLLEMGAHICTWLGAAFGLAYRQTLYSSVVSTWGSRVLLAMSAVGIFVFTWVFLNPVVGWEVIDGGVFMNSLLLAYLGPSLLIGLIAPRLAGLGLGKFRMGFGAAALISLLLYITLEVMRLFQGDRLSHNFTSDAESYSVSLSWLVLSIGLIVLGLRSERQVIRIGGVAVLVLALLKTFGQDLWQLGGLWQIAGVMGMGLSLVGVGWLYARFKRQGVV